MNVRKLKPSDAVFMLEWMHDENVIAFLDCNFSNKTIEDCLIFIKEANCNSIKNLHLAVVDDNDEYMGTISLKNIDYTSKTAEFAIVMRRIAMGKNYASIGMRYILNFGRDKIGLKNIYWCVKKDNTRAVKFYDKNNYSRAYFIPENISGMYAKQMNILYWYYF